jgi:hypothetical protein
MIHNKLSRATRSFLFALIFTIGFSTSLGVSGIASATSVPAQVVARTGQNAVDVNGWTYNGLLWDNPPQNYLQTPKFAGDLVAFFSSLRQGTTIPATDHGLWLVNQNGTGRVIARPGQPAPDTEFGTSFLTINPNFTPAPDGRVLFVSTLSGPQVNPAVNYRGMWESTLNSLNLRVREGDIAGGTSPIGTFYSLIHGLVFDGTAGYTTGIVAHVTSPFGEPNQLPITYGTWAVQNTQTIKTFWTYGMPVGIDDCCWLAEAYEAISPSGRGAFTGRISGTSIFTTVINGVTVSNNWGVWRIAPGTQELVARTMSPAPGTSEGTVFRSLPSASSRPAVNSAGDVVFWGMLAGSGVSNANNTGLWRSSSSGVSLMARAGDPAPAIGTGVRFGLISANSSDGTLWVMNNGDAVFVASLDNIVGQPGGVNLTNNFAVYKRSSTNQDTLIARTGVPNSALPDGTTLAKLVSQFPIIMKATGNDHVMFTSQLAGSGVTTANDSVLMRHTNSTGLQLVAREGQQIGDFILKSFTSNGADLQLTDNYYAVVSATFSPASNPTASPQPGILGISPDGAPSVLAVKGSPLTLSDGTSPNLLNFRIDPKDTLNNSGKVVFSTQFSSNPRDEAVLVAQIGGNTTPSCQADFNNNGTADVPDIFAFLSAWFAQDSSADFDNNGQVQVPDIFSFLNAWFAGC